MSLPPSDLMPNCTKASSNAILGWRFLRLSPETVLSELENNIEELQTEKYNKQRKDVKEWLQSFMDGTQSTGTAEEAEDFLKHAFKIFDKAFFHGALTKKHDKCILKFARKDSASWTEKRTTPGFDGYTLGLSDDMRIPGVTQSNVFSDITILEFATNFAEPGRQSHSYLDTLLHEMIHSVIHLYICNCINCYGGLEDGHGPLWTEMAAKISHSMREVFGVLDFGIRETVDDEDEPLIAMAG